VDTVLKEDILAHAALISNYMPPDRRAAAFWFGGSEEPDKHALSGIVAHTTVLPNPEHYGGTACIFLRPDQQCALQTAAQETGLHPWRFKPFYCILHPLEIKDGYITLDNLAKMLEEPASCLRSSGQKIQLMEVFRQEISYLLGDRNKSP